MVVNTDTTVYMHNSGLNTPPCPGPASLTTSRPSDVKKDKDELTDVRLPLKVIPSRYDVTIKPDIYTGNTNTFVFSGNVSIMINCKQPTDVITLHIHDLEIDEIQLLNKTTTEAIPTVRDWSEDKKRQFLKVPSLRVNCLRSLYYFIQ